MNNTAVIPSRTHTRLSSPVSSYRRHGALYVSLHGEEAAAIHASESFLIDFCGADFQAMPFALRPAAVREAQGHLLVVYLGNPNIADVFLEHVANAAGLTKSELRQRIRDRADFANHSLAIIESNRASALQEIESWLNH